MAYPLLGSARLYLPVSPYISLYLPMSLAYLLLGHARLGRLPPAIAPAVAPAIAPAVAPAVAPAIAPADYGSRGRGVNPGRRLARRKARA